MPTPPGARQRKVSRANHEAARKVVGLLEVEVPAQTRNVTRAVARRLLREAQERERREHREREMAEAAERARQLAEMVGVVDDMPAAEPAHVQEPLVHAAEPNDECGFVEDFTCNLWLDAFDAGLLEA